MSKKDIFYEVTHKGRTVGYLRTEGGAQKYAEEFAQEINGYNYPVKIIKREFLNHYEEDVNS